METPIVAGSMTYARMVLFFVSWSMPALPVNLNSSQKAANAGCGGKRVTAPKRPSANKMESGELCPAIAIIIAARNVEAFIGDTLLSVFKQSIADFELVVVLDRSTDKTADIVRSFTPDPRLKVIEFDCDGVSVARNIGLEHIKAPYCLFLDGDDILAETAFEAFLKAFAQNEDKVAVVGGHSKIDESGRLIKGEEARDRPAFGDKDALEQLLRRNTIVNGGTIAIRTSTAREVDGFDPV